MSHFTRLSCPSFIARQLAPETSMGWVHPRVGLDRLNRLAASEVEVIEKVCWGLRAGLLLL